MARRFEMPDGRNVTIVAWGIEERYDTRSLLANKLMTLLLSHMFLSCWKACFKLMAANTPVMSQGKGSSKGREVMGGKLHWAFEGFFMQVDVRAMWPKDPATAGRPDYDDMLRTHPAKEALNVFLAMIWGWLTFGHGKHLIFSVTCPGLS